MASRKINPETEPNTKVLIDKVGQTTYIGRALPSSLTTEPVWQIMRITNTEVSYANGDDLFDKIWTNRLSYEYK